MEIDVNFANGDDRFNFRVGELIFCKNKVLLTTFDDFDFYNFPGGRAKLGESTSDALKRELKEELDYDLNVEPKLKVICEDFFKWQGRNIHEINIIYQINLPDEYFDKFSNFKILDSKNEYVNWFDKIEIKKIKLIKDFMYNAFNLPKGVVHYINSELIK